MKLNITVKYSLILLLPMLAAFSLLWMFFSFMAQVKTDVPFTNIAGRQRMLSEQLHSYAQMVRSGQEEDRKPLKALISRFSGSLDALQFGGPVDGSAVVLSASPAEVSPAISELSRIWLPLKQALTHIADLPLSDTRSQTAYATVSAESPKLTEAADRVVGAFEAHAAALQLRMRNLLIANAVLAVLLLLLGFWAVRRYIVAPVRQLTKVASAIDGGDYAQRAHADSQDELGALAETVNSMAGSIEASILRERELRLREENANRRLRSHEVELELLNEELSNANAAKSQFLANSSHELRTPLNSIIGFSDLLGNPRIGDLSEKQRRYVNNIHVSGERLLTIINDLLDISKIEAGMMVVEEIEAAPSQIIRDVLHELDALVREKRIELTFEQQISDESVYLDAGKLHQMLVNVVGNAIKFTPEGGEVCIYQTMLGTKPNECRLRIRVADTGQGIAEEDQEKIFEPFVQAKGGMDKRFGGTGLGLALTRRQINLLGGEIYVQSKPGEGSCFSLEMPVQLLEPVGKKIEGQGQAAGLKAGEIVEMTPASGPSPRVLIIDMNTDRAEAVEALMHRQGYETCRCEISRVDEEAEQFCPFLVALGVSNGRELLHQNLQTLKACRATKDVPVVLVGGGADELEFSLGPVGMIKKGGNQQELLDLIARHNQYIPTHPKILTVLVIDDEPGVRELLSEILVTEGYRVLLAGGGKEGVRMAIELEPDLIILDVMMPDVSGFDVVNRLNRHPVASHIPVVVYTAKDLSREEALHFGHEVERVLIKGVTGRSELLRQLHKLELMYPARAHLMDAALGCFNLRYIHRRLDQEISNAKRFATQFALICWQVDDYAAYIHKHGERWGVAALKTMLETVRAMTRNGDICARMDEARFLLFLPGVSPAGAVRVAEKMRIRFKHQRHLLPDDEAGVLTASFSTAHYCQDADDADGLLRLLSERLAEAVKAGGDQSVFGEI